MEMKKFIAIYYFYPKKFSLTKNKQKGKGNENSIMKADNNTIIKLLYLKSPTNDSLPPSCKSCPPNKKG